MLRREPATKKGWSWFYQSGQIIDNLLPQKGRMSPILTLLSAYPPHVTIRQAIKIKRPGRHDRVFGSKLGLGFAYFSMASPDFFQPWMPCVKCFTFV